MTKILTIPRAPHSPDCYGKFFDGRTIAENDCGSCSFIGDCSLISKQHEKTANEEQAGGDHYKRMSIQPWDVIDTWSRAERIGFYRGNLLKYTMRMHDKDTLAVNIAKAAHYARKLSEVLNESDS